MKPGCTCLSHKEGLIISNGSEKIKNAKRTISSKKKLYAIFFNSSGPVIQVPCPSDHSHWPILQEFCTEESERVLQ